MMYSDNERQIFRFQINGEKRAVDPIAAMRKLTSYDNLDIEKDFTIVAISEAFSDENSEKIPTKEEWESYNLIIEAAREAFNLPPFENEQGYLDNEVIEVLNEFLLYSDSLKKKSVTSPMSAPSMAVS